MLIDPENLQAISTSPEEWRILSMVPGARFGMNAEQLSEKIDLVQGILEAIAHGGSELFPELLRNEVREFAVTLEPEASVMQKQLDGAVAHEATILIDGLANMLGEQEG